MEYARNINQTESKMTKVAFVEHPVSKDEKHALNREGYKVVDIKFKPAKLPDGAKVVEKPKSQAKK